MTTFKADIVGGASDSQWHGEVTANDGYEARLAAMSAALKAGFRRSRYTEVYLTAVEVQA